MKIKLTRLFIVSLFCVNIIFINANNEINPYTENYFELQDSANKTTKAYSDSITAYNDSIANYNDSIISYNESLLKQIEEYTKHQNTNTQNLITTSNFANSQDLNKQLVNLIEESKKTNELLLFKSSDNSNNNYNKQLYDQLEAQRKINESLSNQLLSIQQSQQRSNELYQNQLLAQSSPSSMNSSNNLVAQYAANNELIEQLQKMQKENDELNKQFSTQVETQRKTNEELNKQLTFLRDKLPNQNFQDSEKKNDQDFQNNATSTQANQVINEQFLEQLEKQQEANERLNKQLITQLENQYKKNDTLNIQLLELRNKQYKLNEQTNRQSNEAITDTIYIKNQKESEKIAHLEMDQDSLFTNKSMILSGNNNVIVGNNNIIILASEKEAVKKAWNLTGRDKYKDEYLKNKKYTENFFEHFSIGLKASTFGPGVELATTISRNIQLRGGYNFVNYSHNFTIETKDDNLKNATNTKDYYPDYKVRGKFRFHNGHALLDIYPMHEGIFHFTGGVFLGESKISADGRLIHPDTKEDAILNPELSQWPNVNFADYQIKVNNNGKIKANIELGNFVKPYFGIGLGRSVPKGRFGLKFEIGALYQGDFVIKQNGKELQKDKNQEDTFIDEKDYTKWLKFWPMINLQLIYRFN